MSVGDPVSGDEAVALIEAETGVVGRVFRFSPYNPHATWEGDEDKIRDVMGNFDKNPEVMWIDFDDSTGTYEVGKPTDPAMYTAQGIHESHAPRRKEIIAQADMDRQLENEARVEAAADKEAAYEKEWSDKVEKWGGKVDPDYNLEKIQTVETILYRSRDEDTGKYVRHARIIVSVGDVQPTGGELRLLSGEIHGDGIEDIISSTTNGNSYDTKKMEEVIRQSGGDIKTEITWVKLNKDDTYEEGNPGDPRLHDEKQFLKGFSNLGNW